MLYDEERMIGLIRRWAVECCLGFGDCEGGPLYASFAAWVFQTRSMKRLPGRTVFGAALRAAGYEKFRKGPMTHWAGIALKPKEGPLADAPIVDAGEPV